MFAFRATPARKVKEQQNGQWMRIIGIDPGLRVLGWGVIDMSGSKLRHVANGACHSQSGPMAERLLSLFRQLTAVIAEHAPEAAAVEQTFVNRDGAGTLKLGQARGIAMLAPAAAGLEVGEYAPNAVKKTVVGVGHADKQQVAHMVKLQLPGCTPAGPDAADALALAICHAHHLSSAQAVKRAVSRAGSGSDLRSLSGSDSDSGPRPGSRAVSS